MPCGNQNLTTWVPYSYQMKYIFIWNGKIIETARGTRGDVSEKPYQSPATAATEHPQKKKKSHSYRKKHMYRHPIGHAGNIIIYIYAEISYMLHISTPIQIYINYIHFASLHLCYFKVDL